MSENKHTPGPWSVRVHEHHDNPVCWVVAPDVNGYPYDAEILGDDEYREQSGGYERRLADCALIASAPDMLAALKAVLKAAETGRGKADAEALAEASIAKAEGRS